jgi:hypothetical protein
MRSKHLFFFVILTTLITITSCKKDEPVEEGPNVVITFHEPTQNASYDSGDTVHINISVTSDSEMHGYDAVLINTTTGETVWDTELHFHETSFSINDTWVNDVAVESIMLLKITAEIDHEGNTMMKEVGFYAHPM